MGERQKKGFGRCLLEEKCMRATKGFASAAMLILCAWAAPLWAQSNSTTAETDTADKDVRYEVAGTRSFGVLDREHDVLVIDTTFDAVVIVDDHLFECSYSHYRDAEGQLCWLPAPVTEYYDEAGLLMSRNYTALLEHDKPRYESSLAFAKAAGLKDLESLAKYNIGVDYKVRGMRREAYQYFMRAYKAYPAHTFAKEQADAVHASVEADRAKAMNQFEEERMERLIAREQRQAEWESRSNLWNSYTQQAATTNRTSNTQPQRQRQATTGKPNGTSQQQSGTTAKKSSKPVRTKSAPNFGITKQKAEEMGINDCPLCYGRKTCNFCSGRGKVNGTVTCRTCKGTGTCSRCKGTGKWKN